jgi:hypothetical protein
MIEKPEFKKMKKDELVELLEAHWISIENAKNSITIIDSKISEIESKSTIATTAAENIASIYTDLTTKNTEIKEICSNIETINEDVEESREVINDFYNKLVDDKEGGIKGIKTKIEEIQTNFETLLTEYIAKCKSKEAEHQTTFSTVLKDVETKRNETFQSMENERKTLFKKIEDLLPSATSAGLASSYKDAQDNIKSIPRLWCAFFIVILGLFGWYAYFLLAQQDHSIGAVLAHVLTGSPLIWLAWYLQRSISQQSRIFQEYNHKQRVMNLYEGFVRAIHESGSKDQKVQLLTIMLDTVKSNPANIMGGHETLLESLISKFKIPFLNNKLEAINTIVKSTDNA